MTTTIDHVELLRASEKFQMWRKVKPKLEDLDFTRCHMMDEKHYAPSEIAEMWGVSIQTIREIFKAEEGVLKIGSGGTRNRRGYKTLRIPASVAKRVHARLSE